MYENNMQGIRELYGLQQEDVAKILGVKRGSYASWECGEDFIPVKRLYDLANYYCVNCDYLLGLTNKKINIECNEEIDFKKIGLKLKSIREKYNYTQQEFVKSTGICQSSYSTYENGKSLTCVALIGISHKYNISIDELLCRIK